MLPTRRSTCVMIPAKGLLELVRGCTFDDFLLAPQWSVLDRRDPARVDLTSRLSAHLTLKRPIVSANMDTVTRAPMAIVQAQEGGIGIIDRGFRPGEIEAQVREVQIVKRTQHGVIPDPYTISGDASLEQASAAMARSGVGTLVVVDGAGQLQGLLTERDIRFIPGSTRVADRMTPRERLIVHEGPLAIDEAARIMVERKVKKLPLVDRQGVLTGLITAKDIGKQNEQPFATRDAQGRLRVGAAIGARGDYLERAAELIRVGVDAAGWRGEALQHGYASVIALPLLDAGCAFGALAIYAAETDTFGAEEVDLLTELTHDLAYGILALRTRAERQRMEDEVGRQREARYQSDKLAALGQLLAGVAHELNNPLSVVTGRAAILGQKLGGQPLAQDAAKIEQAAQRCARIVRNFLALARQQPPERREVNLNNVVRDAVELLAYHLRLDNVDVTPDLGDPLPDIWADPHQLHQVVINLVTNAHHAMRQAPAPRRLTLTTRYLPASRRVRLEVADSGPGIPPEVQARIFEPFFTTKRPGEGTGLGLSLCHGIIEDQGGTILVESRPGHGAVFQIELPVGDGSAAQAAVAAPEAAAPIIARSILVVDDEPEVAAILAEMLVADGHRIETATNGAVALAKLAEGTYDVILSDLRMPEMDGPALYGELQRRFPHLAQRIIFFTGDSLGSEVREFLERTAAPRVSKPFDFAELRYVVAQVGRGSPASTS